MGTDDYWDDFFEGSFESIVKRMERMLSDMRGLHGPDVRAFEYTVYQDPDGNRHVIGAGDSVSNRKARYDVVGEPLTDVTLEDGIVRAVVEIPGVSKEDIVLGGTGSVLTVAVDTDRKKFARALTLPCKVDPDSVIAEYNNGILEVTMTPAALLR
jgi:HSP20 family molecular chaperone IbpA